MKILANRKNFIRSRQQKPAKLFLSVAVMILFCGFLLLLAEARFIYQSTERTLEKERQKQSKQNAIPFSKVVLTPRLNKNVQIIQSPKNIRSIAKFNNSIFAATDGGLIQISENGDILRRFSVLDGLPESDLTAVAVFQSKLFIGTKSKGLISFDGEIFEAFRLENLQTKSITALFSYSQTLLIGTFSGGLLEFDGSKFSEIKALDKKIEHLTFLQQDDSCLLAGTFANGLWIRKNQIWKQFTTANGLLSNRIVGVEIYDNNIFIATDLGISVISFDEFLPEAQTTLRQNIVFPTLSGFIFENGKFYLTKDNGDIFALSIRENGFGQKKISWKQPQNLQSSKLFKLDYGIWFFANQGLWKCENIDSQEISLRQFSKFSDDDELTSNIVSSMAIDNNERLWIGTFRDGIDVFSSNGTKFRHLESETIREINFLTNDAENNQIIVATSGGAIRFDANLKESIFAENTVLPSRSVTQISLASSGKNQISAISTTKGLFFKDKNSNRIFSSINGLPGNNVFSAIFAQNSLFIGTISGLAQIANGKVVRVFKTTNSELKNNWISALCLANDRIFIGTYGGGIFELLPSGEIRNFETEIGTAFVDLNAMFFDGERLFAGTLEGVWCLNLTTQKWTNIHQVLPSESVLSITGNGDNIYFGTTNGIARISKDFWIEN